MKSFLLGSEQRFNFLLVKRFILRPLRHLYIHPQRYLSYFFLVYLEIVFWHFECLLRNRLHLYQLLLFIFILFQLLLLSFTIVHTQLFISLHCLPIIFLFTGLFDLANLDFEVVVFVNFLVLCLEVAEHFVGHTLKIHENNNNDEKYKSEMLKTSKFNGFEALLRLVGDGEKFFLPNEEVLL